MTDSHDIKMVLITGAGASTDFGIGPAKLPLMPGWSNLLVAKLVGPGFLEATGLERDLPGPEFEKRLGDFLQVADAFERIGPILAASATFHQGSPGHLTAETLGQWHRNTVHQLGQIRTVIYQSLYEQFGPDVTNTYNARRGYEALLSALRVSLADSLVVATTNYDVLAESALRDLGRLPDWGESAPVRPASQSALAVDGLLEGLPRFTPVLHLHGRVGWYRTNEEPDKVQSSAMSRHDPAFGSPVIVLPDPQKTYPDLVLASIWRELESALKRARRVFVVGHSLNDPALVAALKTHVSPPERIMVGVYPGAQTASQFDLDRSEDADGFTKILGGATVTPFRFGAEVDLRAQDIDGWLRAELGN